MTLDFMARRSELVGGAAAKTGYTPDDQQMLSYTGDPPNYGSGEPCPAAGIATGVRLYLPVAAPIPRAWLNIVTVGTNLTTNACYGALWDATGTVLDQSDDQAAKWMAGGVKDLVFPSSGTVRPAGWYDVGWWWNGTGNTPQMGRGAKTALNNLGLSGRMTRFWTFGSAGQFTSVAPSLGTKVASNVAWWVGLSAV